jgi:hypothetical protein
VLLGRSPGWYPWLRVVIVIAALAAACLVLAGFGLRAATARARGYLAALPVSLALIAGLGGPLAYSIDTAATAHSGASPSAGPTLTAAGGAAGRGAFTGGGFGGAAGGAGRDRFGTGTSGGGTTRRASAGGAGGFGGTTTLNAALAKLLETGASGYKWAAATVGSDSAASMELGTGGVPVMAIGGFSGTDPAPALAAFEQMVADHEVHYFILSAGGAGGAFGATAGGRAVGAGSADGATRSSFGAGGAARGGTTSDSAQVEAWVEDHFTATTVGGETVYNLTAPKSGS